MPFKRSSLLWLAGAAVISAVAAQTACGTGLPIGQASLSLELGEQTATKSTGKNPTRSPVNITMFFPQKGVDPDLPWVMMMNGANCYGQDYTYLLSQLAGRGYLAVAPTQLHPAPPKQQGKDWFKDQADQCDKDSFAIVTASLVNDVHSLLSSLSGAPQHLPTPQISPKAVDAMKSVNTDSIVLVSHSAGAVTAVDMLAGKCNDKGMAEQLCANYTPIMDRQGRNALKGAIAFEGYADSGIKIPDGMFLTYMAGQYNDQTQKKYEATKGKCIQYVELAAGNHYAITDWNPDTAPHQKAPCGAQNPHDDPNFETTKEDQEERLNFIAEYTDAMVRATVLGDKAAASFLLNDVADSHLVRTAKVSSSCLVAVQDDPAQHSAEHSVSKS
ncbi:hypothetical protein ABBQ38_005603 [Trebouxia sp. C0009 RCD-2024]